MLQDGHHQTEPYVRKFYTENVNRLTYWHMMVIDIVSFLLMFLPTEDTDTGVIFLLDTGKTVVWLLAVTHVTREGLFLTGLSTVNINFSLLTR